MRNRNLAATARKKLLRRGRALLRARPGAPPKNAQQPDYLAGLSESERRELAEIHAALERIERGIYGRCDGCFSAVEADRLEAIPWERHCASCRTGAESRPPA